MRSSGAYPRALDWSPVYHKPHTERLFTLTASLPSKHVSGLWEEVMQAQGEHANSPDSRQIQTQELFAVRQHC